MSDWFNHRSCNKFDPDSTSETSQVRQNLERYLHYYVRYQTHNKSQEYAKKQLVESERRMLESESKVDVEFVRDVNRQLVECRRVLKYTYAFGYYLNPTATNQKERFEYHQVMLERFTESLSELSEKPLEEIDRTDAVNQTRVVRTFVKNILQYVEEGMDG